MDVKFGKIKSSGNMFLAASTEKPAENFFATNSDTPKKQEQKQFSPRINDYDSNILEDNAYQTMPDETFKIEHKISLLEESLTKMINEIEILENLGYDIQVYNLKNQKQKIEQELVELNKRYSELGISAKISGHIASAVNLSNKKMYYLSNLKRFLSKKLLSKFSKKFNYRQTITEALDNLSNINSNVDELINMQTPYGENINRYEKLTAYLNKANVIHAQIYNNVDKLTKKKP